MILIFCISKYVPFTTTSIQTSTNQQSKIIKNPFETLKAPHPSRSDPISTREKVARDSPQLLPQRYDQNKPTALLVGSTWTNAYQLPCETSAFVIAWNLHFVSPGLNHSCFGFPLCGSELSFDHQVATAVHDRPWHDKPTITWTNSRWDNTQAPTNHWSHLSISPNISWRWKTSLLYTLSWSSMSCFLQTCFGMFWEDTYGKCLSAIAICLQLCAHKITSASDGTSAVYYAENQHLLTVAYHLYRVLQRLTAPYIPTQKPASFRKLFKSKPLKAIRC